MSKSLEALVGTVRRADRASADTMPDGDEPGDGRIEPAGTREVRQGWPTFDLRCIAEDREEHPDRCVVYPRDAEDAEVSTRWIAASEGSFLALESVR